MDALQDASDARSRRGAYKHAVFMTPDDGFIMGSQKTLYHLHRCPCPTCNVFRCRVRNGVDHQGNPITVLKISEGEFETLKEVGVQGHDQGGTVAQEENRQRERREGAVE